MREVVAFAPGRANLAGEHTDYNDGLALPFAIAQGVTVKARARDDDWIEVSAADLGETDQFLVGGDPAQAPGWRAFARGAVGELQRAGFDLSGAFLQISGSVAPGSGLASSAALSVALCLSLLALSGVAEPDRLDLARLCSRIENDWVGARTGLLDQLASLLGRTGSALRIDFRSLEVTPVPFELGGWRLVLLDSGQRRELSGSGYNERRRECAEACRLLGIASLRDANLDLAAMLPEPLDRRVRHVVQSNHRVDEAVEALRRGDLAALGAVLDASQVSLRELYQVSTPAIEAAVSALKQAGAAGSRLMGGGFGGHVLGLMPPGAHPPPGCLDVRPGPGAGVAEGPPGTMHP